jgi:YggT family protein
MSLLITIINILAEALTWLVIFSVLLSYLMDPYQPVRRTIDSIVEPMLRPFRRVLPLIAGIDWSPVVLIFLIQTIRWALLAFLVPMLF